MTERRVVFLDFDGTYADRGFVPPAHVAAVRAARARGHLVLLCTGRPRSMLHADILGAGFDGFVAAAGGYVELAGEVLVDRRFPAELAATVLGLLDSHDIAYLLEAPDAVHGLPGVDVRLRTLLAEHFVDTDGRTGPDDILANLRMAADLSGASFGKVTLFDSPVPVSRLAATIGAEIGSVPSSLPGLAESAGELFLADVHKAVGMEAVVAQVGVDRRDVVAFGDGLNDVEMLRFAGIGVAIEGSHPEVLAAADTTAAGPGQGGLAAAFATLGLV